MSLDDIKKTIANIENDVKSPDLYNLEIFTPTQKILFHEFCNNEVDPTPLLKLLKIKLMRLIRKEIDRTVTYMYSMDLHGSRTVLTEVPFRGT